MEEPANQFLGYLLHFCIQFAQFCYCYSLLQLVDDALDFSSTSEVMGKQTNADLSLGLATAPVLFAAQKVLRHYPLLLLL